MNKSTTLTSVLLAAGATGVALLAFANLSVFAGFAIADTFSFVAAAALIGFALSDYARRPQALRSLTAATPRLVNPVVAVAAGPRARATAYGLPRNRSQRIAA